MKNNGSHQKSVILADDNRALTAVWARALREEGFSVHTAHDGKAGLKEVTENEVPIIFSDLDMPGLNGMELLESVKRYNNHCCVNIITGHASLDGAVKAMRIGACDYLAKPCDNDELVSMAYRCVRHQEQLLENNTLRKTLNRLEEVNLLKSEFVSNVSHELRTPLFALGAALDLLVFDENEIQLDHQKKHLLEIIQGNHLRLTEVIQNLLDFSQIERGRFKPQFKNLNMTNLILSSIQDLSPLALKKHCRINFLSNRNDAVQIEGDQNHIRLTLTNLIGNAIKFSSLAGQIKLTLLEETDSIIFTVWNSGKGIPQDELQKIFHRFYQIDGSLTRENNGTGIGLTIVKSIVDMHRGRVWAESTLNEYTQINVSLPKKQKTGGPTE